MGHMKFNSLVYLKNPSSIQLKLCGIRYILSSFNLTSTLMVIGLILTTYQIQNQDLYLILVINICIIQILLQLIFLLMVSLFYH